MAFPDRFLEEVRRSADIVRFIGDQVALAIAAKAVYHNTIPPSLNTDQPDPACRLRLNHADPYDAPVKRVLGLAYALGGGQNAALVIRRYRA